MEIFELRYFLGAASCENLHRAAERLHVSPGSLSKAITRLENELGMKLFRREGRNIRLTDSGRLLERRASEIAQLEEATKLEIAGARSAIHVVIAGDEIVLSQAGMEISDKVKKRYPRAVIEYHALDEAAAIAEVVRGDAHLGIVTQSPPAALKARTLGETKFVTCVGPGHPLHAAARAKRTIPIETVLEHGFVSPSHALLGHVGARQSFDGWRDDKFPRRIDYRASQLRIVEEIVLRGKALAYLPDYFAAKIGVETLKISGCPYYCEQTIRLITRPSRGVGWVHQLFG